MYFFIVSRMLASCLLILNRGPFRLSILLVAGESEDTTETTPDKIETPISIVQGSGFRV